MLTFRIHYWNPETDERGHEDIVASRPNVARGNFFKDPSHRGFRVVKIKRVKG